MNNDDIKNLAEVKKIPDQMLIDHIKLMLEEAESGELRVLVSIKLWDDEQTTHGWCIKSKSQYAISAMIGQTFQCMTELSTEINGVPESIIKGDE